MMIKSFGSLAAGLAVGALMASTALAQEVTIRVQSVIPAKADEVHMLNDFAKDVADLTNGEVKIEGGFAWTDYWSGKHPAAMLFGSPVARRPSPVPVSTSTTSRFFPGFNMAAAKSSMIASGTRWASM